MRHSIRRTERRTLIRHGTQFADGYRRHLDWHTRAGDPWAWYMWRVSNGERAGLYVDGTFSHAWSN